MNDKLANKHLKESLNSQLTEQNEKVVDMRTACFIAALSCLLMAGDCYAAPQKIASFAVSGSPIDVVIDSKGYIYVLCLSDCLVKKYTTTGSFVSSFGGYGTTNDKFKYPWCMTIDSKDNLYIFDALQAKLKVFNTSGTYLRTIGSYGDADTQYGMITDMAVDQYDNLFVCDNSKKCIHKFSSSGAHLLKFGTSGSGNGEFYSVTSIAIDQDNIIHVADDNRESTKWIQTFYPSGAFRSAYNPTFPCDSDQCNSPAYVIFHEANKIYSGYQFINVFDTAYNHIETIGYKDGFGTQDSTSLFVKNGILCSLNLTSDTISVFQIGTTAPWLVPVLFLLMDEDE